MSSSEKVSDQKTPGPTWTDAEPYFKITPEDIRPPATPEEIAEAAADLLRRPFRVIQAEKVSAEKSEGETLADLRCFVTHWTRNRDEYPSCSLSFLTLCESGSIFARATLVVDGDFESEIVKRLRGLVGPDGDKVNLRLKLEIAP